MQIPNDPILNALGPATSSIGIPNAWIVIALAFAVLFIVFLVLYIRKARESKHQREQIEELNHQVLGLTAMTQLYKGEISEEGDSVVYQSTGPVQQIAYEDFPEDAKPVTRRPEDIEDVPGEEDFSDVVATIHSAIKQRVSDSYGLDEIPQGKHSARPKKTEMPAPSESKMSRLPEVMPEPESFFFDDEPAADLEPLSAAEILASRESEAADAPAEVEEKQGLFARSKEDREEKRRIKRERKERRKSARAHAEAEMAAHFEIDD